ncbi:MAG: hypothetical protein Q8P20_00250 [bacterium]|nr:hypothetical protein [bacterium]
MNKGTHLFKGERKPTVYSIKLLFDNDYIFDTRKPDHLEIFNEISQNSKSAEAPDDIIRTKDLMKSSGSLPGLFPSYSIALLAEILPSLGFKGCFISEGSEGTSLLIFNRKNDIEIINKQLV